MKSGFVNIIGRPNVGKSTLVNALVGERLSIINKKPQTTRHRIIGILNGDDFQIVFSDTPGFVKDPSYKMHKSMNRFVEGTIEDADVMIFVADLTDKYEADDPIFEILKKTEAPILLVLNKKDAVSPEKVAEMRDFWLARHPFAENIAIAARDKIGTEDLLGLIKKHLPEGEPFYPADQLTDRSERFFVSEIIREKILDLYSDEIPYATEVGIESFKETETNAGVPLVRISAVIFVMRETQKMILLGKGGLMMKKLATKSRESLETFLEKKVFLEVVVKVRENWRDDEKMLARFGY
jgi:GTPase